VPAGATHGQNGVIHDQNGLIFATQRLPPYFLPDAVLFEGRRTFFRDIDGSSSPA